MAVTNGTRKIWNYRDLGLVSQALTPEVLDRHWGNVGIGHVRYGTAGSSDLKNAQPYLFRNNHTTFALAFNGNVANYDQLRKSLHEGKGRLFLSNSDTEVIAKAIASTSMATDDWVENLKFVSRFLDGSYSLLVLTRDGDLYVLRDPMGYKPLCYGTLDLNEETVVNLASSESCAIDAVGGQFLDDVKPGELIHLAPGGNIHSEGFVPNRTSRTALCQFEFVYFARPDSVIDGVPVEEVRVKMGRNLAKTHPVDSHHAVVVPVPDSGRSAALGYARQSGHPFAEGLMKNRYVWRTFIMPGQEKREDMVRQKLNPIKSVVRGRDVVLVDDSIVRGTTMRQIVRMLKRAGAASVHVRIACPEVREPCYMGVDFPTRRELIVGKMEVAKPDDYLDAVRETIEADSLGYQTIDGLVDAIGLRKDQLCLACLDGNYPLRREAKNLEETFSSDRT